MNIYFDIGGVLFQDGMTRFINKLAVEFGIENQDSKSIYTYEFKDGINARKLRTGDLSIDQFYIKLNDRLIENYKFDLLSKINVDEITFMWFDEYEPIHAMFDLIENIKSTNEHTIGIISANFTERFNYIFQKHKVLDLFEQNEIHLTCDLHLDKKDPLFYKTIAQKISLELASCIYIEDKIQFINIAKKVGFTNSFIFEYRNEKTVKEILKALPFLAQITTLK